jgi:hypothetical protein
VIVRGAGGTDPELAVSWDRFQVNVDIRRIFDPLLLLLGVLQDFDS